MSYLFHSLKPQICIYLSIYFYLFIYLYVYIFWWLKHLRACYAGNRPCFCACENVMLHWIGPVLRKRSTCLQDRSCICNAPPVNSSLVNSSPGRLVTQSTRHKEAVNSSPANIKAVLPTMYWSPQLLGRSFQKAKKNSQQVVTRMEDFTSEFSTIFRGWYPRRPGPDPHSGRD